MRVSLIIHERKGRWARQLRPRVAAWSVLVIESRSGTDLSAALAKSACPIVLLDLGDRLRRGLEDLDQTARTAPNALILVLADSRLNGFSQIARELGATLVLPSSVPPPAILDVIARWLPLSRARSEADGWAEDRRPEPEPWEIYLDAPLGSRIPAISRPTLS